ncbi:uncharacterized protein TNCT_705281 [Trichonephila clavata]|uniref:Uncharacterized protein n=1 Tax=Trichonephila clavata TaxID=2740835 RepID=A0A8X6KV60_TRICU|nr:uncharacterized protein TNCT_705281 [Trichonephila clavata]
MDLRPDLQFMWKNPRCKVNLMSLNLYIALYGCLEKKETIPSLNPSVLLFQRQTREEIGFERQTGRHQNSCVPEPELADKEMKVRKREREEGNKGVEEDTTKKKGRSEGYYIRRPRGLARGHFLPPLPMGVEENHVTLVFHACSFCSLAAKREVHGSLDLFSNFYCSNFFSPGKVLEIPQV